MKSVYVAASASRADTSRERSFEGDLVDPMLAAIAERLIAALRYGRDESISQELYRRQDEATTRGRLQTGFYAQEQRDVCLREFNARADAIWDAYRRVVQESATPWSSDLRDALLDRIHRSLEKDASSLEEMARGVITPYGHSFTLFLRDSIPSAMDRLTAEIDLFGLRFQPRVNSLEMLLAAPRYEGPAGHWRRVEDFVHLSPPDLVNAAGEAVGAVEGVAKIVVGDPHGTLGDCIKNLRGTGKLDGGILKSLEGLWGFVSNSPGIRHGAHVAPTISDAEARWVVQSSEAGIRLLLTLDTGAKPIQLAAPQAKARTIVSKRPSRRR